jgi:hypothetical protein
MNKNKFLTLRIPYGEHQLAIAAYAMETKKVNRETLRKFLMNAISAAYNDTIARMPLQSETTNA